MSRWSPALLLATALLVPLACTDSPTESLLEPIDPFAKVDVGPGLTVMSQNLYLGLSGPAIGAGDPLYRVVVYVGGGPGTTLGEKVNTQ